MAPLTIRYLLLFLALSGAMSLFAINCFDQRQDRFAGISDIIQSKHRNKEAAELKILFIGNSYTYYNNLPGMLVNISDSDLDNSLRFMVQSVTREGIGLNEHWNDGHAVKLIRSQKWDYVVLQEKSTWAMLPESVAETTKVARMFVAEIRAIKAQPVILITWAREPGSIWYENGNEPALKNPEFMQTQVDINSRDLALHLGAIPIPVGDSWAAALASDPSLPLYDRDATHPAPAGTYLTALVLYRHLTGRVPHHTGYVPVGMTAAQAAFLQQIIH